jgi:D-amino-acid dehydrogenase
MGIKKVAIVGTGVAGLTTAYFLAKKGYEIDLFDRNTSVASECSYANGGQISVCNAEVWNTWENVMHGLGWLGKADAPLSLRLDVLGWKKIKWLANFLGTTALGRYEKNTRKIIEYSLRSRELLLELESDINIRYDQQYCGIVHVYSNGASYRHALESNKKFVDTGWNVQEIDVDKIEGIKTKDIVGATIAPDDWVGDINLFCRELFYHLMSKYPVSKYKNSVTRKQTKETGNIGLDTLQRDYDEVIVAAGADTARLVPGTGIYPVKGYSITIKDTKDIAPKYSILDDEKKIVSSTFGDKFRVAGTAELAGYNTRIREDRLWPLLKWTKNTTYVEPENYTSWACLRPMTPNMLPIVKKVGNVWVNSGAGHLGWTMGMALAEKISGKL